MIGLGAAWIGESATVAAIAAALARAYSDLVIVIITKQRLKRQNSHRVNADPHWSVAEPLRWFIGAKGSGGLPQAGALPSLLLLSRVGRKTSDIEKLRPADPASCAPCPAGFDPISPGRTIKHCDEARCPASLVTSAYYSAGAAPSMSGRRGASSNSAR